MIEVGENEKKIIIGIGLKSIGQSGGAAAQNRKSVFEKSMKFQILKTRFQIVPNRFQNIGIGLKSIGQSGGAA